MGHALELAPRPSLWAPPLYWSGRYRPSDLHVPKVLRQAVLRGRLSASDGGNACPTLRPRDFHDTGVRTGAGEPRMRTGESLPGGGRLLPSSGSRAAFGARAPVVLCDILGSSAPTSRDSRRGSRGRACMPHAACRMPPWRFLRTRQGGVVSTVRYLARSSRGLTPSLTVVPWRLTGTLRTPSSSELPLNACLYQNILMLLP